MIGENNQEVRSVSKPRKAFSGDSLSGGIKPLISRKLSALAANLVKRKTRDLDICIFSNDCWGGEFYRFTNRQYNTPFVGLMVMAPCYIRFLKNPRYYLNMDLKFIEKSKYDDIQEYRENVRDFPIGLLDDVEVHFLHYLDAEEAYQKWNTRKRRVDWNNLYVKFSMDKDYADENLLKAFEELPYKNKISFSKHSYKCPSNVKVTTYVENGAQMFTRCFRDTDLLYWFRCGMLRPAQADVRLQNLFISRFLRNV